MTLMQERLADIDQFDDDGYPTDEVLDLIIQAEFKERLEAFRLAVSLWKWDDRAREIAHAKWITFRFSTGGWSGNESIIGALNANIVTGCCWELSRAGGRHIYRVPKEAS